MRNPRYIKKCSFFDARIQLWSAILQRPFLIVCPYFPLYSTRQTPRRTITLICQRSWQVHCTHITLEGCSSGPRLGPWRPSSSSAASTSSSSSTGEAAIALPLISDPKKSQPHIIRQPNVPSQLFSDPALFRQKYLPSLLWKMMTLRLPSMRSAFRYLILDQKNNLQK